MKNQNGSALVIALIVMVLLAALIIGFSTNTNLDLFVGRNSRILKQAFQWSDTGLEVAKERISISEEKGGINEPTAFTLDFTENEDLYGTGQTTL